MRFKVSFIAMAVMALVSVSFAQGQGGGGGRGQGRFGMQMGGQRLTQMLRNPQVQTELKLTDDQKSKIDALPRGGFGQGGPGGGGGQGGNGGGGGGQRQFTPPTPEEQLKQLAEEKKTVEGILTADQAKRLYELRVQWAGANAVTMPDVQVELGLTDDQKAKIATLQTNMRTAMQGLMEKMRNGEIDRSELMPTIQKNNEIMKTEVDKVLTDAQKAKLKAMGGTELKQEMRRPGGGGGRRNG